MKEVIKATIDLGFDFHSGSGPMKILNPPALFVLFTLIV
jgi:hypothetical protein